MGLEAGNPGSDKPTGFVSRPDHWILVRGLLHTANKIKQVFIIIRGSYRANLQRNCSYLFFKLQDSALRA